jgi:hypothetical protein
MSGVPPLVTHAAGQPLYGSSYAAGTYALSSNLTWGSIGGGSGIYAAQLSSIPCNTSYVLNASVQTGSFTDVSTCRLIKAEPDNNSLFFWLNNNPVSPSTFGIAWRLSPPA